MTRVLIFLIIMIVCRVNIGQAEITINKYYVPLYVPSPTCMSREARLGMEGPALAEAPLDEEGPSSSSSAPPAPTPPSLQG